MTSVDVVAGIRWMTERDWVHKAWAHWEVNMVSFAPYSKGALMEALVDLYESGRRFPPHPNEVLKEVKSVASRRALSGVDVVERTCFGVHVWADPSPTDDDRHRVCVLCGEAGLLVRCEHLFNSRGFCAYCNQVKEKTA
jgi:hypothetical protein